MAIHKSGKTFHEMWCIENGLIMSGRQLTGVLGIGMQKLKLLIAQDLIEFPRPVKTCTRGNIKINYYKRVDIERLISQVDLKAIRVSNWSGNSIKAAAEKSESKSIDIGLYCQFMGISAHTDNIRMCGTGYYAHR
jgi:hypothetical protein